MKNKQSLKLKVDNKELKLIINSLNYLRNKLIQESRPTDVVDELIIKSINVLSR